MARLYVFVSPVINTLSLLSQTYDSFMVSDNGFAPATRLPLPLNLTSAAASLCCAATLPLPSRHVEISRR